LVLGAIIGARKGRDIAPGIPATSVFGGGCTEKQEQCGKAVIDVDRGHSRKYKKRHVTQSKTISEGCLQVAVFEPSVSG
jgi:hypothetical protein